MTSSLKELAKLEGTEQLILSNKSSKVTDALGYLGNQVVEEVSGDESSSMHSR